MLSVLCSIAWPLCALRGVDIFILTSASEMSQMGCCHVGNFLCYVRPFYFMNSASKVSQMECAHPGKFVTSLHPELYQRDATDGTLPSLTFPVVVSKSFRK